MPAALEVSEPPASPLARATAITIAAFVVLTLAWASIGDLDIVATAPGKVVPSERVKTIQPLETSIVRAVNVTAGKSVQAGDVLVELEVKRYHYDSHKQFEAHLENFVSAYNFARRLKTLRGLTPYEYICKIWETEPERFRLNPHHQMPGLNT